MSDNKKPVEPIEADIASRCAACELEYATGSQYVNHTCRAEVAPSRSAAPPSEREAAILDYIVTVTGPTGGWLVSPKDVSNKIAELAARAAADDTPFGWWVDGTLYETERDAKAAAEHTTNKIVPLFERAAAVPAPGSKRPKIVCLCGSTRFYEQFMRSNYELTMQGVIVLSVGFVMHSAKQAHGEDVGCTAEQKIELDKLHKRKIDLADEVLVLNVGGYIGESTRSEIEHAERTGKPVNYLEPVAGATAPPKEAQ